MKKITTFAALALALAAPAAIQANVHVDFPENFEPLFVKVTHQTISDIANTKNMVEYTDDVVEEMPVSRQTGYIILTEDTPARYSIDFENGESAVFYAAPNDQLRVEILNVAPLLYTVSGSELTEGWTEFERQARPVLMGVAALNELDYPDPAQVEEYNNELANLVEQYIINNPGKSSAVAALLNLHGQDFLNGFGDLAPEAHASILYPMVEQEYMMEMASITAPEPSEEMPVLAEEVIF